MANNKHNQTARDILEKLVGQRILKKQPIVRHVCVFF